MSTNFSVRYEREPGQHDFTTLDGTSVTAIAVHSWEEHEEAVRALPADTAGYVVSPELITTPMPLDEIPIYIGEAQARVETMRQLSVLHPNATFLVGTPSQDGTGRLYNSLAVVRNGELDGHVDKRGVMWIDEAELFERSKRAQAALQAGHAAVICSDLITVAVDARRGTNGRREPLVPEGAETLIVSCCWATPRIAVERTPEDAEAHFRSALENTVSTIFAHSPTLNEIIVVDRSAGDSQVAPLTAQFRRAELAESR